MRYVKEAGGSFEDKTRMGRLFVHLILFSNGSLCCAVSFCCVLYFFKYILTKCNQLRAQKQFKSRPLSAMPGPHLYRGNGVSQLRVVYIISLSTNRKKGIFTNQQDYVYISLFRDDNEILLVVVFLFLTALIHNYLFALSIIQ